MKVEFVSGFDPLPVSSYDDDTFGYQIIKKTVRDIFPQVTVSPGKAFSIVITVIFALYQELKGFKCLLQTSLTHEKLLLLLVLSTNQLYDFLSQGSAWVTLTAGTTQNCLWTFIALPHHGTNPVILQGRTH